MGTKLDVLCSFLLRGSLCFVLAHEPDGVRIDSRECRLFQVGFVILLRGADNFLLECYIVDELCVRLRGCVLRSTVTYIVTRLEYDLHAVAFDAMQRWIEERVAK